MTSPSENVTFEPLEMPPQGDRIRARPVGSDAGRQKLVPLVAEALDKCRAIHFRTPMVHPGPSCNPHAVVEVGSWAGASALEMVENLQGAEIFCVDHWQGSKSDQTSLIAEKLGPKTVFQVFCRNLQRHLLTRIHPCVGKSRTWAEIWPFQVSAVFIDAGHDYESVTEDIELWWPHVLPGGLLIGHDFSLFPDVERAVKDWFSRVAPSDYLHTDQLLWWVWKPESNPAEVPF